MAAQETLHVLIVDDEPLARRRIETLLARHDDIEVAGQAENGDEAVEGIRRLRPDLVFLDVQMPKCSGLEVVRDVGPENMPAVIFVTAYDEYALEAFEVAALDYLVKPFDNERFEQALRRARKTIVLRHVDRLRGRLVELLAEPPPAEKPPLSDHLERIAVDLRGQMRVIPVEEIDFITAEGSYAELHVGEDTYLIRERMQKLEDRLDPRRFVRIHRSHIVQIDRIEALLRSKGGNYAVRLKDGRRLKVSRSRRQALEEQLGAQL